jgi:hypothetical protein
MNCPAPRGSATAAPEVAQVGHDRVAPLIYDLGLPGAVRGTKTRATVPADLLPGRLKSWTGRCSWMPSPGPVVGWRVATW